MTPQIAARRFVATLLRQTFGDVVRLTDPPGDKDPRDVARTRMAYARVETAVRRQERTRAADLSELYGAVSRLLDRVPADVRGPLWRAIERFENASVEESTIKQTAAYLIGLEVGRALQHRGGADL